MRTSNPLLLVFSLLFASGCSKPDFQEFSPAGQGFRILMPGKPTVQVTPDGDATASRYTVQDGNQGGYVVISTPTDFSHLPSESRKEVLDSVRDGMLSSSDATMIKETDITYDGIFPGRELVLSDSEYPKFKFRYKIYIANTGMYQVCVIGEDAYVNGPNAQEYFNSFKIDVTNSESGSPPEGATASTIPTPQVDSSTDSTHSEETPTENQNLKKSLLQRESKSELQNIDSRNYVIQRFKTGGENLHYLNINHTGSRVLTRGKLDNAIRIWSEDQSEPVGTYSSHSKEPYILAFSPDDRFVLSCGVDDGFHLWETESQRLITQYQTSIRQSFSAFSGDGKRVASPYPSNDIHIWDAENGQTLGIVSTRGLAPRQLSVSTNGMIMISMSSEEFVIWNSESKSGPTSIPLPDGIIPLEMEMSENGSTAAVRTLQGLYFFDPHTGSPTLELSNHGKTGGVRTFALSGDGLTALLSYAFFDEANGTWSNFLRVIDIAKGEEVARIASNVTKINKSEGGGFYRQLADLSQNGDRATTLGKDGILRLWDINAAVANREGLSVTDEDQKLKLPQPNVVAR